MKKTLLLSAVLLALTASFASAAGLNLSWGGCGTAGAQNVSDLCDENTLLGSWHLFGSAITPTAIATGTPLCTSPPTPATATSASCSSRSAPTPRSATGPSTPQRRAGHDTPTTISSPHGWNSRRPKTTDVLEAPTRCWRRLVDRPATFTGFWRAQNAARRRPRRSRIPDTPRFLVLVWRRSGDRQNLASTAQDAPLRSGQRWRSIH